MSDEFLKELWEEKAKKEKAEKKWKIDIFDLENLLATKNKEAKKYFIEYLGQLKKSCLRYLETCEDLEKAAKNLREGASGEELATNQNLVKQADMARRLAHNVVVDNLNILSRLCKKYNLDDSWRKYFSSFEMIGEWAYEMGKILKGNEG